MAEDRVQSFVDGPTPELLGQLTKAELVEAARLLDISVRPSLRKDEIKDRICQFLVKTDIWSTRADSEEEGDDSASSDGSHDSALDLKTLEAQLKLKELELRTKEVELQMKSLDLKSKELDVRSGDSSGKFDACKYVRLVPKFDESKVEEFFQHFEKVAVNLGRERSVWPTLVQSVLIGRAQEVYASLSVEEGGCYEQLKSSVLRAYELVPEAHRQAFRNTKKGERDTYVDLVRKKVVHFERWLSSTGVNSFESLKELMLSEELKRSVSHELRQYLEERDVMNVQRAAVLLDEYVLTHKVVDRSKPQGKVNQFVGKKDSSWKDESQGSNNTVKSGNRQKPVPGPCYYCKQEGHRMSECSKLKKKREKEGFGERKVVPNALASVKRENRAVSVGYKPFVTEGFVSLSGSSEEVPIRILRDTGATQTLLLANVLPFSEDSAVHSDVFVRGIGGVIQVPLHSVNLKSAIVSGQVDVGVSPALPVEGVSLLVFCQVDNSKSAEDGSGVNQDGESDVGLNRLSLIDAQGKDPELVGSINSALSEEEAVNESTCFYMKDDILMRRWRPPDASLDEDWRVIHQVVVPKVFRRQILKVSHETDLGGHLGVNKTVNRILKHFFWPGLRSDVSEFCRACHACQVVGKPNQKIPPAPLRPIPAFDEPFSTIIVDCVGPLPKTKAGHEYLLTMMCAATRFPEAVPLRRITAQNVCKALVKFFSLVGLPRIIQSDQGSNFTSKLFRQVMSQLGIRCVNSIAYHPESQGALERFHQTLKNMMRTYCFQCEKEWDEGLPLLLFAVRESVQDSLGFSPFDLVFGHTVRGPLLVLKEKMLESDEKCGLLDYVSRFRERLSYSRELAMQHMKTAQADMKKVFDRKARERSFDPGSKVLVLLPIPGNCLQARYSGPYVVEEKVSEVNYVIRTPDKRKQKRLCHINMLKEYVESSEDCKAKSVASVGVACGRSDTVDVQQEVGLSLPEVKLENSEVLENLGERLNYLPVSERESLQELISEYSHLFGDVPSRTTLVEHVVDVGECNPIKQHPYRLNPSKLEILRKEVNYMIVNDIIEPSSSQWSFPCVLVPKKDGSYRFCTDYRLLNSKSKSDSYPIPRIDDLIDKMEVPCKWSLPI
ncbi:uncharacterized protein LOC121417796 [Lytechinus variegatus]|uniref:uncharacterized protein LOC121417796 n=1 Tax=Lytechinus variegatus TaxID=7654 RepID=UPI001BB28A20|nr:uncharacterized protein LOC121417796 [Lytechinus variegatus]